MSNVIISCSNILAEFNPLLPVTPVPLFQFSIGGLTIVFSNHMFVVTIAFLVLLLIIPLAGRSKGIIPNGRFQNLIEAICVFIRDEMSRPLLKNHTDRYISFIWTMFFFILTLNLLGIVPIEKFITLITRKENHFGGPATANIWITGGMAVVTFFTTLIAGIREHGFWKYFATLAPPVPIFVMPFIYALEITAMFVRPFALAIRLFANILAGHTLLATFIGLIFIFKSYFVAAASVGSVVVMSLLELLVAFIQAYIFTFLSVIYISFSVTSEH